MLIRLIVFLIYFLTLTQVLSNDQICTKSNCQLPSCQCAASNTNPTGLNTTDTPQLILLTFVGNLNEQSLDPIRSLLNPAHRNPNKCPISSTFFVNDNYTEYCLVQRLFDNRNEIAMTTSSNRCPLTNCYEENHWRRWIDNDWKREIQQQRANLIEQSRVHYSHLKGFRVPHLQIDENKHWQYIRNYHFHYDSSMLFKSSNLVWPFTMNYQFNQTDCLNCAETNQTIDSLWQFPLHEWINPNTSTTCRTLADPNCLPDDQAHTVDFYFDFIKHNFERHSSLDLGQRSPFIIELDLFWLADHKNKRLEALIRFIEMVLSDEKYRHVYFVSIEQALQWLQYPRKLSELDDFWAFSCSDIIYEYDIECFADPSKSFKEKAEHLKDSNETNSTDSVLLDRQAEDLFRSGIVLHSVWITFALIIIVLFYDKYFTNK